MRKMEAFIVTLIAIIGICFLINIILASPSFSELVRGFIPSLPDARTLYAEKGMTSPIPQETALYLSIGIIGATVMPHNLYLHSALVQTRKILKTPDGIKQALKWSFLDSAVALNMAFLINTAILVLAASVFFKTGRTDVGEIRQAHELLSPMLGSTIASTLFAVALIAAGQSSTVTGTLAGQIVMEGYLSLRINPVVRRLITRLLAVIPAAIVIALYGEDEVDSLLIFSQVLLSLQLGFAIIPLIHFVSDKHTMGEFRIKPIVQGIAWIIAGILVYLNIRMVSQEAADYFENSGHWVIKSLIILAALFFGYLLLYSIIFPLLKKTKKETDEIHMHPYASIPENLNIPVYKKIAIGLDFGENDMKLIASSLGQAREGTEFVLIHIVESPSAILHGKDTDDFETQKDRERLDHFVFELKKRGYQAKGVLGFKNSASEIVRIVREEHADLVVLGAHGHTGLRDFIYGATVNAVRHELQIPVLVINL